MVLSSVAIQRRSSITSADPRPCRHRPRHGPRLYLRRPRPAGLALVRRAVLARLDVLAVGAGLGVVVDVGTVGLVEWRAIADHQDRRLVRGAIDETMGVAAAGGEADAHAGPKGLRALVRLQHDL